MKKSLKTIKDILSASALASMLTAFAFIAMEPAITTAAAVGKDFTVSQVVTSEIAFITAPSNVALSPSIGGITGGTGTGQMQFNVLTNNPTGYNVTLTASSTPDAMKGNTQGGSIKNYTPTVPGTPDFAFAVGANTGEFGYTVSASTTSDVAPLFLNNGTTCNVGAANAAGTNCWYNPSTVATTIINRGTATTASGATSTLYFKVQITANPSPAIPADTYVATSTLTATTN